MTDSRTETVEDPASGSPAPNSRLTHLSLGDRSLREHTARGTIINAAFSIGLAGLNVSQRFFIAIFLTVADYGLWGLIFAAVTAVLWLKEVGIGDKFVQQDEPDQELAFQKAFTLNLMWSLLFFVLVLAAVPAFAQLYGRTEIILPGFLLALTVLSSAFRFPTAVFYRQMRFVRQRALQAIEPVVGFVVTMTLGIAGFGYWSLVIGLLAGVWAAAAAATIACPYRLALRYDRGTLGEYVSFSWPLLVNGATGLVVVQVSVILGEAEVGLAGVAAIGLAGNIAAFADRVDQIVMMTLYPAVCAVRDRVDLLFESFTKSNRLALIWGMPFGFGLALFAPDLVNLVLGDKWEVATALLQVFGITAAVAQIGFNWPAFQRAVGDTKPLAVHALGGLSTFIVVGVPGLLMWGLTGYAVAIGCMTAVQLAIRTHYLRKLFGGFDLARHSARAIVPVVPAVGTILALRLVEGAERPLGVVFGELALYAFVVVVATWTAERTLLRELTSYLRRSARPAPAA